MTGRRGADALLHEPKTRAAKKKPIGPISRDYLRVDSDLPAVAAKYGMTELELVKFMRAAGLTEENEEQTWAHQARLKIFGLKRIFREARESPSAAFEARAISQI